MTPTEWVEKYIEEREASHEDDDMPGDSEEFRAFLKRTLVELVTAAVEGEREACARAIEEYKANRPMTAGGRLIAEECVIIIRERR